MGSLHLQLGPTFQAIAFAEVGSDQSLRAELEKSFSEHPYDPSTSTAGWPKYSLCGATNSGGADRDKDSSGLKLEVPKMDLISELPGDCIARMVRSTVELQLLHSHTNRVFLPKPNTGIKGGKNSMERTKGVNGGRGECFEALQRLD